MYAALPYLVKVERLFLKDSRNIHEKEMHKEKKEQKWEKKQRLDLSQILKSVYNRCNHIPVSLNLHR